jgi:hypothetical protein
MITLLAKLGLGNEVEEVLSYELTHNTNTA